MVSVRFIRRLFKKKKITHYIDNNNGLLELEKNLSKVKILGIDTEFDWRTTYFPTLSIIQIAIKNKLFLVDCLKVTPEETLKFYLENKEYLKVFHSVRSDTNVLSKCLGINTKNVFDIQIADKFIHNDEIRAYGKIVNQHFGIHLKKSETNSNWLKRPLSIDQIDYALDDVDYLLEIFKYQKRKLIRSSIYNQVVIKSNEESELGNKSLKVLRLKKQEKKLSKRNREIFLWREEIAEADNIPPTFVFKDKYLNKLSKISSDDNLANKKIMTILGDSKLTELFISSFLR
jgi:ribonuclease D